MVVYNVGNSVEDWAERVMRMLPTSTNDELQAYLNIAVEYELFEACSMIRDEAFKRDLILKS